MSVSTQCMDNNKRFTLERGRLNKKVIEKYLQEIEMQVKCGEGEYWDAIVEVLENIK